MIKIERRGHGMGVTASGSLADIHQELALLICTLAEKYCDDEDGMSFDDFLILTLLLAKKSRTNITAVDMSDFRKFIEDLDLNN